MSMIIQRVRYEIEEALIGFSEILMGIYDFLELKVVPFIIKYRSEILDIVLIIVIGVELWIEAL